MGRRIAAMFAFVALLALALTLLYRVYLHRAQTGPRVDDGAAIVVLASRAS